MPGGLDPFPPEEEESSLMKQLLSQLQRSMAIRKMFSRYCIPFYILCIGRMLCLLFRYWNGGQLGSGFNGSHLSRSVFLERIGIMYLVQQILLGIKSDISYKRNTDLYYVMRSIQKEKG
ncbi:hypothetical protein TNCT_734811 [Trichonephila clavata]|uniref:Uncharacterized protein n=1 Tax=Trichonephila clavata TaxID=2740835 RepID=A0A8X6FWT7_TRICU|nr:hypothetical protein TNCT_734811 [Trichonephila clavata]